MTFLRTSAELSFASVEGFNNPNLDSLDYWQCEFQEDQGGAQNKDLDILYDCYYKILCRGVRTFPSYALEVDLINAYGGHAIRKRENEKSISYDVSENLKSNYVGFTEFARPLSEDINDIEFDPDHPDNERRLFSKILERFGSKIAYYIYPQAPIESLLPINVARNFTAQRLDFLIMFPNGKGLIIEPGDHDDDGQRILDKTRDDAFLKIDIKTIRPSNADIDDPKLYDTIAEALDDIGSAEFLQESVTDSKQSAINNEYLFLLPSLISRIEYVLMHFLLSKKMILKE